MTQKILFEMFVDYDPKDIRDLIGDYSVEYGKIHVSEDQLAILVLAYKGNQYWYQNGKLHRDNDMPAVICVNGSQEWYQNGNYHRNNDMPAVITPNGSQFWYQNGKLHRDNDMPAVIRVYGSQEWYQNGERL